MWTIRRTQMEALRQSMLDDLQHRLREHLMPLAQAHGLQLTAAQMDALTLRGLQQCRQFALRSEADAARYMAVLVSHWRVAGAEELPVPAMQILLSFGLDPAIKLARFEAWAAQAMQDEAQELSP
jgi:hypothetical protein